MTDSQQEKVQKLHENQLEAQTELNTLQQKKLDSITNGDRRVRVERFVKETEDAMTKAFTRNDQLLTLASKTSDSETIQTDLEKWLSEVTEQNDEVLRRACEYNDSCIGSDVKSHSSVGTVNKSASKRSSTSVETKTLSQRQEDLLLATHRRDELKRQNANAIRLKEARCRSKTIGTRIKAVGRRTSSLIGSTRRRKQTKTYPSQAHRIGLN